MSFRLVELSVALILVAVIWIAVIQHWRRGLVLALLYSPIAGAVELWLYPASWGVLIKDILFFMPAYIGFVMSGELGPTLDAIPKWFGALLLLLIGITMVQALNPAGPGLIATMIGLKVWLFYVPVMLLGYAYVRDRVSLVRLSRLMIGLAWLPCAVGILQWLLSMAIGYHRAIEMFYGDAAVAATQQFAQFQTVGVMRIPGTFPFATQYLDYVLCMFAPVLGSAAIEGDKFWQKLRIVSLALLCVGGLMTGVRAAFLLIPLSLGVFYLLSRGGRGVIWLGVVMAGALAVVFSISGIDPTGMLQMETNLSEQYAGEQAGEISDALQQTWIGLGTGTSTEPARAEMQNREDLPIYEGYYAKAVAELGIIGCLVAIASLLALIILALRAHRYLYGTDLQPYCDAIAALAVIFFVYSYKGPIMSLDPPCSLYWLFAGVLFALPRVAKVTPSGNLAISAGMPLATSVRGPKAGYSAGFQGGHTALIGKTYA
jgi:hypothetical protein